MWAPSTSARNGGACRDICTFLFRGSTCSCVTWFWPMATGNAVEMVARSPGERQKEVMHRLICHACKVQVPGLAHARPVKTSKRRCDVCGDIYPGTMYGVDLPKPSLGKARQLVASKSHRYLEGVTASKPGRRFLVLVIEENLNDDDFHHGSDDREIGRLANTISGEEEEYKKVVQVGVVKPEMLSTTLGWLQAALIVPSRSQLNKSKDDED